MERQIINVDGLKISTRKGSSDWKTVREIFKDKVYQKPMLGFLPEKEDCWIDLGGNIGSFSLWVSQRSRRVYTFEMDDDNYRLLTSNVADNGIKNVRVYNLAVVPDSFENKSITYYKNTNPNHFWMHSLYNRKKESVKRVVKIMKFRELLQFGDCFKIDIEGAEIPILTELEDFSGIRKLVFEWSFDKDPKIETFRKVLEKLKKHFKNVNHVKLDPSAKYWKHYPPATNVFCWN